MTSSYLRIRTWINKRFIIIIEIVGYLVSAILGVVAIYCLITYEDVYAYANGTLKPISKSLMTDQKCVIYNWTVSTGDIVQTGKPVANIVTDKIRFNRLLASRQLTDVIKSLNMAGISSAIEINKLQSMQDNLGQRPELMQVIYSPGKGIISVSNKTGVIKTGDTLATIYDLSTLVSDAILEASKADKVTKKQVVRLTLPELERVIIGQVVDEPETEEGGTIRIQFNEIPNEIQNYFNVLATKQSVLFPKVRASIVVGRRSLFSKFFGRSF